jgi:nitroimidazol reductase NimA-like FMN-containing flavoprotein (pyridoxamine 5'-phosphate oxidase superfamily)
MDPALRSKILVLLDEHRVMTLATLRPDGWPHATTVGYVSDGLRLYFMCGRESQKARNLAWDDRVSLTIDRDVADPMGIRGLSMAARAAPVQDDERFRRLLAEKMPEKFPEYAGMIKGADLDDVAFYEVVPAVVSVLDYSLGFGHSDLVEVGAGDL